MIRIRYRDPNEFPAGFHAEAEADGRGTTVYLMAGLTGQQRKTALRRLKLSARRGSGPPLPRGRLAVALAADRAAVAVRQLRDAFRLHPAGISPAPTWPAWTVPGVVLAAAAGTAVLLFLTVSVHIVHGPPIAAGAAPAVPAGVVPAASSQPPPNDPASGVPAAGQLPAGTSPAASPATTAAAGPGTSSSAGGSSSGGGTTLSGTSSPAPSTPAPAPAPAPSPSPTPATPTPSPSASSDGTCLDIGPLGVCLSL